MDRNSTLIEISSQKSEFINILCIVVGWTYFILWSASYYPQVWMNYKRKSVVGMDFNYVFLNVIANGSYSVFNFLMYFDKEVQAEYLQDQPNAPVPVLLNDVVFAVHALILSLVFTIQIFIYERGSQRVHPILWFGGVAFMFATASTLTLCVFDLISRLELATLFSYVKIVLTAPVYIPQLYLNYRRKSTTGFSMEAVVLDFAGGVLSLLQMVCQAWNVDDWSNFVGNPVKSGLALLTIVLDSGYFLQHFCFYRHQSDEITKA